jgi:O-antigen/teichoic acid export membrane protein
LPSSWRFQRHEEGWFAARVGAYVTTPAGTGGTAIAPSAGPGPPERGGHGVEGSGVVAEADVPRVTNAPGFSFPSIGRHSLIYAAGIFASKGVAFILLPVYTRYLTPADYGILQLIVMTMEVIALIAGSRLAHGIFHFYHKAQTERDKRSVLSTALALLVTTYGITAVASIAFAPSITTAVFGESGAYATYLRIAILAMAGEALILVPVAHLQLNARSKFLVGVQVAKMVLQASLNIVFLIPLGMGVSGVLLSSLIGNAVLGLLLAAMLLHTTGFVIAMSHARDLVRFGVPLMFMQVATMLLMFGDRFFLNRAAGEAAVGLYGLAHQFGLLLLLVAYMPFEQIWNPTRFEVAKRPDRDEIYSRAFTYLNLVLVTGGVGIGLFVSDVLRVMAAPPFHAAAALVPGILLGFLFQAWKSFHNVGLMITERTTWYAAANWVAAGIALIGFVTLIPRFGTTGAVATFATAFFIRWGIVYSLGQYFWPVRYRWTPTLVALGWGGTVVVTALLLPAPSLWISILYHVALFAMYLVVLWRLPILGFDEREAARRYWQQLMVSGSAVVRATVRSPTGGGS